LGLAIQRHIRVQLGNALRDARDDVVLHVVDGARERLPEREDV
jgi:hypothetical protein